jgi:hypothetical protein
MDRGIIYPGAVPLETDLLFAQKASMVGLAKLAAAVLGTSTMVNGFATTQTTVPSLAVSVAAGEIYQMANIDGTAYSSIAADTTHQILKQGVALDATTLAITPPGTAGFSINYLIEATFAEVDNTPVVLPYYNASNPSTAYSGPANAGTTNNTRRAGTVVLTAKAGTAATTGSQTTPAPDSGCVGLYVVTVANGAASVVNGNISAYSGAPFLNSGMLGQVATLLNTPAQFDNTTKVATTAFVKARGVSFPAQIILATATTLTAAAHAGQEVTINAAVAATLPLASTCPAGTVIQFYSTATGASVARQATDLIGPSSATSVTLNFGDTLILMSDGGTQWLCIGGSAGLQFAAVFGANLAVTGYQKLPSGLIVQWGSITISAATAVTFPITFPNGLYSLNLSNSMNSAAANATIDTAAIPTNSGFSASAFNASTGAGTTRTISWIAFGK